MQLVCFLHFSPLLSELKVLDLIPSKAKVRKIVLDSFSSSKTIVLHLCVFVYIANFTKQNGSSFPIGNCYFTLV